MGTSAMRSIPAAVRLPLLACLTSLALSGAAQAQTTISAPTGTKSLAATLNVYAFPGAGQAAAQQAQDETECYNWAVNETGNDPFHIAKQAEQQQQQAAQQQQQAEQSKSVPPLRAQWRGPPEEPSSAPSRAMRARARPSAREWAPSAIARGRPHRPIRLRSRLSRVNRRPPSCRLIKWMPSRRPSRPAWKRKNTQSNFKLLRFAALNYCRRASGSWNWSW